MFSRCGRSGPGSSPPGPVVAERKTCSDAPFSAPFLSHTRNRREIFELLTVRSVMTANLPGKSVNRGSQSDLGRRGPGASLAFQAWSPSEGHQDGVADLRETVATLPIPLVHDWPYSPGDGSLVLRGSRVVAAASIPTGNLPISEE